jgi:signal transduction histidine kinase
MDSYPGSLGQVITNLFNNAILHGFENSNAGNIHIHFSQQQKVITIIFQDNGRGIPDRNIKRIYDPFYTTKLGKGGSGLGLNIVHNIVSGLLEGEIKVTSSTDGTSFDIQTPKALSSDKTVN